MRLAVFAERDESNFLTATLRRASVDGYWPVGMIGPNTLGRSGLFLYPPFQSLAQGLRFSREPKGVVGWGPVGPDVAFQSL